VQRRPDKLTAMSAWASQWEKAVTAKFLECYRETMSSQPGLLPQGPEDESLLLTFVLEKALYELLYELNNRPNWLHIPLNGILALDKGI